MLFSFRPFGFWFNRSRLGNSQVVQRSKLTRPDKCLVSFPCYHIFSRSSPSHKPYNRCNSLLEASDDVFGFQINWAKKQLCTTANSYTSHKISNNGKVTTFDTYHQFFLKNITGKFGQENLLNRKIRIMNYCFNFLIAENKKSSKYLL